MDVDPRSVQLWLSYTEMELKGRNVQHARNLFDRAVTLLPRVDQLWYKYVYLEELLQKANELFSKLVFVLMAIHSQRAPRKQDGAAYLDVRNTLRETGSDRLVDIDDAREIGPALRVWGGLRLPVGP